MSIIRGNKPLMVDLILLREGMECTLCLLSELVLIDKIGTWCK